MIMDPKESPRFQLLAMAALLEARARKQLDSLAAERDSLEQGEAEHHELIDILTQFEESYQRATAPLRALAAGATLLSPLLLLLLPLLPLP
jgi:hypothetical protein